MLRQRLSAISIALAAMFAVMSADAQLIRPDPLPVNTSKASAQLDPHAVALFDEGRDLMGQGRYLEACPKFEASLRLQQGVGTVYNLSDCYERIGRMASAWAGFVGVAQESEKVGQLERAKTARARAAALEPKLSRIRLIVPVKVDVPGLEVQRDGDVLSRSLWGVAVPVDPGTYVMSATAPSRERWSELVRVDQQGHIIDVRVPMLKIARAMEPEKKEPMKSPPNGSSPLPWMIGGAVLGASGLGMGIGFTTAANDKSDEATTIVAKLGGDPSACHGMPLVGDCGTAREAVANQDTFEKAAIASFVLGGLFVGATVATFVLWPKPRKVHEAGVRIAPWASSTGAGLVGMF